MIDVEYILMRDDNPRKRVLYLTHQTEGILQWLHGLCAGNSSSAEYVTSVAHGTTSRDAADSRTTNDLVVDSSHDGRSNNNWSQCRRVARSLVGTPNYIAPEVLSQSGLVASSLICRHWY